MQDTRTLAEMGEDHADALRQVRNKCQVKKFRSLNEARGFRLAAMEAALLKLGINYSGAIQFGRDQSDAAAMIEQAMQLAGVTIENRTQYTRPDMEPEDQGIYIYQKGELVYFISMIYNNAPMDIFEVTTNSMV